MRVDSATRAKLRLCRLYCELDRIFCVVAPAALLVTATCTSRAAASPLAVQRLGFPQGLDLSFAHAWHECCNQHLGHTKLLPSASFLATRSSYRNEEVVPTSARCIVVQQQLNVKVLTHLKALEEHVIPCFALVGDRVLCVYNCFARLEPGAH